MLVKGLKKKTPIIFNGEDIVAASVNCDYFGKVIGYQLVLKDQQHRPFGLRVPLELVTKLVLKHFKSRKVISAIPKSKYAYVEG